MNNFYVYVHRRADDNKPFYVGKGKEKRAWNFNHRSAFWNNVKSKHGIVVEIVFEGLTEEEAFQCEKDTILEFRYFGYQLVNLTDGGDGPCGWKPTAETRKRMSDAQKTSQKVLASRKIVAERRRGVPTGPQPKISAALKGKPKSEAHKKASGAGKRCKNIYTFQCIATGQCFTGTRFEFETFSQIDRKLVSCLFGSRPAKISKGWRLLSPPNNLQITHKEK